jgi:hypothetical protein
MADYIPKTEDGLRNWANNFSTLITANPTTYGLMASDATAIAALVDAFDAALTLATDPSTKTKTTVLARDAAKSAMLPVLRHYAQTIKLNDGVTNEEKGALGLTIDDTQRTPIPAPSTQPICNIVAATPLRHALRFADAATPAKRAKPDGVLALELHYFVGDDPPVSPDATGGTTIFYGLITRQPYAVVHEPVSVGKTATYYARWITRTGLVGPWSAPVSMTVAA